MLCLMETFLLSMWGIKELDALWIVQERLLFYAPWKEFGFNVQEIRTHNGREKPLHSSGAKFLSLTIYVFVSEDEQTLIV